MLIIAATLLVYWPALRNGFIWDDTALVLRDPLIRSWFLIPEGFRHFLFLDATASNFYRPIQRLSFVADYQLYGFGWPGGWHLTSILVHAGAAIGLFFVADKLLAMAAGLGERTRRISALGVSILWAIHPLHTSAVTYVAGRADLLAALFGFAGLALGLHGLGAERGSWLWRIAAAAGFTFALLSKESGVAFLLIWLLVLAWQRPGWREFGRWSMLIALSLGTYCTLRFTAEKTVPPPPPPTPVAIRPILAARAVAEYASLIIAPLDLRMERDVSTKPRETYDATIQNARVREYQTLAGVLLILAFLAWVRVSVGHRPVAAFCLGALTLAYLPISNLFSLNATVAEHWLYVPSAFLFLAVASTLPALTGRIPAIARLATAGVLVCWVLALGTRTALRQADWRDQRTFIERTIAAGGDSPRMLMNLANLELASGHAEKTLTLYREALRRTPDQAMIWFGYAAVLARTGDLAGARDAIAHAEKSSMLRAECLSLRATLAAQDRQEDPEALLQEALRQAPANWPLRKRHAESIAAAGNFPAATRELVDFLRVYSFRAESWKLLGKILESSGASPEARSAYGEALRRDVRDTESREAWLRLATTGR